VALANTFEITASLGCACKRCTPPHSHSDEDEVLLVLAGGLSYQTSGPDDVRTYAIGTDDLRQARARAG
jgi:hypothetical protein